MSRVQPYELALDPPLRTARETMQTRRGLLFRVEEGPGGIGDAAPLPPFTESDEESRAALERAADAYDHRGWPAALKVVSDQRDGRLEYPAARHAVSLAMLDWRGRTQAEPLFEQLGGTAGAPVPVNATVGDASPSETAQSVAEARNMGFQAVKVKVGRGPVDRDLERLRAVRERVGSTVSVRVDANGAWSPETATTFLRNAADLDLAAVEQPLPVAETLAHADLRGLGTPIAVDESLAEFPVQELLAANVADWYVLKPMALGGVDVAAGAGRRIARQGGTPICTSIFESVVGRTAAVHLAAALGVTEAAGLATADRLVTDLAEDPAPIEDGVVIPPSGPGLGIGEVGIDG
ncbi:O-succinylbenzoate synthase [Halodesulfurarchaeum formicicum]|uniref:o-succinylbenzoate synthase n=1 Tax=Halodesulfurarchaeum formicicum TaxID=1873524 RepID=A0A1D8S539_9EURY|nr:o-succinylbenzoate synthase [Halodesulfurarchaeum formicicum]AOW80471.1 O-succinylbenzoate synthase [Halodesulfurarchaeum formicicum]APE95810.1 O-succinylbenzoate synthase [Halodesulfurarchaeum formicicum]